MLRPEWETVLSAPKSYREAKILNIVELVLASLSLVGSLWMIVSFFLFKTLRSFRHQLIFGLAVSDFFMASNFVTSSAINLFTSAVSESDTQMFCNTNGFVTQLFVIQSDYWIFIIAISTYLLLADHKRLPARWIQDHRWVLWISPWILSTAWACMVLYLYGYGNTGAFCWFTSDKARLLVNFIPRWAIILAILGMYSHLFYILHQTHNRFLIFKNNHGDVVHFAAPVQTGPKRKDTLTDIEQAPAAFKTSRVNITTTELCDNISQVSTPSRANEPSPIRHPTWKLKRLSYQMMSYPLIYLLVWLLPTVVHLYQAISGRSAPFVAGTMEKSCTVSLGLINAVIYGINESSLTVWCAKLFPNNYSAARDPASKMGTSWTIGKNGLWVPVKDTSIKVTISKTITTTVEEVPVQQSRGCAEKEDWPLPPHGLP